MSGETELDIAGAQEEWLQLLASLPSITKSGGGLTMREIRAEILRQGAYIHISTLREKLRLAASQGRIECIGTRTEHRIDGQACQVPEYRIISPPKPPA